MNSGKLQLGVDLGGTNVRAGLVDNGKIIKVSESKLPKNATEANDVLNTIFNTINDVFVPEVEAIGVGAPGLIDMENKAIHSLVNIKALSYVPIAKLIYERYSRPVSLDNDANCFTLAENMYGAGKGVKNMVGVAIGTGLGAGIINNGKLLSDSHRGSGEFGELPYLDANVEAYCSGQFFQNNYQKGGEELLEMAKNNEPEGILAFKALGKHIGMTMKMVMLTLNPEMIVIGGSVSKSKEFFHDAMMTEINDFVYPLIAEQTRIEYATISNISVIGAAALTQQRD